MKKIFSLISAALLLAGTFAFTGCDEAGEILGNTGVWYKYNVTYNEDENGTGGSTLTCFLMYSDTTYTNSGLSSKAYTNGEDGASGTGLNPGLTIVVKNDSGSTVGKLVNNSYAIHTFEKNKAATSSSDNADQFGNYSNFTISSGLWQTLYVLKYDELTRVTGVPSVISKEMQNTFTPVEDFSWKYVLKNILVDKLLED